MKTQVKYWSTHQAHGDVLGECPRIASNLQIQICHVDRETGKKSNILIDEKDWFTHAGHGDTKGSCPIEVKNITICHTDPVTKVKQKLEIPETDWATHQAHGDIIGDCPRVAGNLQIQICHINQTNGDLEPMLINNTELSTHQAHGDLVGSCDGFDQTPIEICLNKQDKTIKKYLLPYFESIGATLGKCPEDTPEDIVICHINSEGVKETMTIQTSEWITHQNHGDVMGSCSTSTGNPKTNFNICHTDPETGIKTTLNVSSFEWAAHQAHGDSLGACVTSKKQR